MDDGVGAHAVKFFEQNARLAAKVFATGVSLGNVALPLGVRVFDAPSAVLRLGSAEIKVELLRKSRRTVGAVPAASAAQKRHFGLWPRHWVGAALVGVLVLATFGMVTNAASGSAARTSQETLRTLADVLRPFNAQGAALVALNEAHNQTVVRGLVLDGLMHEKLEQSIRTAGLKADLQLHDVQQMAESLTRLARLNNHPCEARHLSHGRFACDAGMADGPLVVKLQALAAQVPGVVALEVQAQVPQPKPVLAAAPAWHKAEPVVEPPKLPSIRHVVISARERIAFDASGNRLRVGDQVEEAKVTRIEFDKVELMVGKQRHTVSVSPISLAAKP